MNPLFLFIGYKTRHIEKIKKHFPENCLNHVYTWEKGEQIDFFYPVPTSFKNTYFPGF